MSSTISRRTLLTTTAATSLASALPSFGQESAKPNAEPPKEKTKKPDWHAAVIKYLETLARDDGGYAWDDQPHSHLTPTFAVIACYHLLEQQPPRTKELAQFVRTHHPAALKGKLEQEHRSFDLQQIQSLLMLGEDISSFREVVQSWKAPLEYLKQYEQHGYPVFQHEVAPIIARRLLGLPKADMPLDFTRYLANHLRSNGTFNNSTKVDEDDGHILNTWWGLWALNSLDIEPQNKPALIAWLRACQMPNGGFAYSPRPAVGGLDDLVYTWAAVRSLVLLGTTPSDVDGCLAYVVSLTKEVGTELPPIIAFSSGPGWNSNPLATHYAIDTFAALGALTRSVYPLQLRESRTLKIELERAPLIIGDLNYEKLRAQRFDGERLINRAVRTKRFTPLPAGAKVFSIQIQAHGQGSPAEAVDLAASLRIHFWGAKNAKPEWLAKAQAIADQKKAPVKFFVANEEYGTWINIPGQGTYSHISDIIAPLGAEIGPSLANQGVVSWEEYRERRLKPLVAAGGRLLWQFNENEPLSRMLLDDSITREEGYAAISTYHFGNPDFTNSEPFLECYRGQIPFVALQDAHGPEPWWFADMTTGFRTLFIANQPTWVGWLEALKNNWVAAVRRDAVTGNKLWLHGGSPEVLKFIDAHYADWQWWDNYPLQRLLVSLVAIKPDDEFEVGRPDSGIALRIRCAFGNTTQGLAKNPLAEFVELTIDGQPVTPTLVTRQRPNGLYDDHYHIHHIPNPTPRPHTATVVVKNLATDGLPQRTIQFTA